MKMLVTCPRGRTFDSFFDKENVDLAKSLGEVVWNPYGSKLTSNQAQKLIVGCDTYVTVWGAPRLDGELLAAADSLRIVMHLGNSPLPFVSDEAWKRGIVVLTGEKYYTASAAEGTLAYILCALRQIPEYSMRLKYKHEWKHSWDGNRGLVGKTVGIVNYNPVAARLARLLQPFDVKILVYDESDRRIAHSLGRKAAQVSLEELFACSDIVTVHTPERANRYHMIGFEHFAYMKDGALLIDTSIGGLINRSALVSALTTRRIFAVLDVYEQEPPNPDELFFYLPNVILMPHMGGPTHDVRSLVVRSLLRECADYIEHGIVPKHRMTYSAARRRERDAFWDC